MSRSDGNVQKGPWLNVLSRLGAARPHSGSLVRSTRGGCGDIVTKFRISHFTRSNLSESVYVLSLPEIVDS